jgi:hypothetical protein
MTESTYIVSRLEGLRTALPIAPSERACDFQLSNARWRLVFRDGRRGISGGLLNSRLGVEAAGRRRCRVTIEDDTGGGFSGTAVIHARPAKLRRDLDQRLAALERAGEVVAEVAAGSWWVDDRVFAGLDWSERCSLAGVHYRAGWWGTGRLQPSMLAKVLDFGPGGVVLRGWRTRLVIPWDAIGSIRVLPGDCWVLTETVPRHQHPTGTTVVIRSLADQDAVFYTPLVPVSDVGVLLAPLVEQLPGAVPATV